MSITCCCVSKSFLISKLILNFLIFVHLTRKLRDGVFIDMAAQAPQSRPLETYTSLMLTGLLFGLIGVRDRYDREQTIRAGRVGSARASNPSGTELTIYDRQCARASRSRCQL